MKREKRTINLFNMNYKQIFSKANEIAKKKKKNKMIVFFDIIYCGLKYQSDYLDYDLFEMYNMNKHQRKTVITRGINNDFMIKYNDPKYIHIFSNKIEFNENFKNYINRDWIKINGKNKKSFEEFCKKHQKIIAKTINSEDEKSIQKIDTAEYKLKDLYEELLENNQILIEETLIQNDELNNLHPESINTLKIVTLLGNIVTAYLSVGNNQSPFDSFHRGGMIVPIELETGDIIYPAIDKDGNLYETHPLTKAQITGIKIPKWDKAKQLCEEASLEVPQVGYVEWSVCIGKEECFLIKGKAFPENNFYGLPPHRTNNIGLLPVFCEAEERKYEE